LDDVLLIPVEDLPPSAVVFRPRRRLLVLRSLRTLAVAGAALAGWWLLHLTWLPLVLAVVSVAELLGVVRAVTGAVGVSSEGLRVSWMGISRRLPWSSVFTVEVRTTRLGRSVWLGRRDKNRPRRLPAPASPYLMPEAAFDSHVDELARQLTAYRQAGAPALGRSGRGSRRLLLAGLAALLTAGLLLDQPWGWPPGPTASSVPDPCPLTASRAAPMVGQIPAQSQTLHFTPARVRHACEWDLAPHRWLLVAAERYGRWGLHSGTWRATVDYANIRHNVEGAQLPGLPRIGDESIAFEGRESGEVFVRRGDVIIAVVASGPIPHYDRTAMLSMARAVADAITLN